MNNEDEKNFLYHYQNSIFKESAAENGSFSRSYFKRQSINQIVAASNKVSSNETLCHLMKNKLREYSNIVDKQDGVNNYASGVLEIVTHSVNDAKKWTSKAKASDLLERFLQPFEGECLNFSNGGCAAQKPSLIEFEEFLNNKKPVSIKVADNRSFNVQRSLCEIQKPTLTNNVSSATNFMERETVNAANKRPMETRREIRHQAESKIISTIGNKVFGTRRAFDNNQQSFTRQAQNKTTLSFRTAGTELKLQNLKKYGQNCQSSFNNSSELAHGNNKKSLGGRARCVNSKFVPPIKSNSQDDVISQPNSFEEELEDERLRLIDPKMVELIRSEIMDHGPPIEWSDIAGLQYAKVTIQEIVVLPMLRPDIFTGLRRPPKGILLFGPPGTGKTLIGKCIASQSKSTFFNISASSLTSKWVGEGEKMVRTLFTLARIHQPAVVFIDEIDSLLSQRSETEHESSRRIKTEFLVQLDGAGTGDEDRILVIGATNRPQELDEAARRRLVKRLYIPLPDHQARCQIIENLMKSERNSLTNGQIEEVASLTEGYSGADMKTVCQEACLGPIRSISFTEMQHITPDQVRPVTVDDFKSAVSRVRSSVSPKDLDAYLVWDQTYGAGGAPK